MIFRTGYLTVGRYGGAPIRFHWTTLIGAYFFTGADYVPGAWLGFILLVLAHEIGHAMMVRAFRCRVVSVDVHGFGGVCSWEGSASDRQRAAIAWGGVLAQLVVLFMTALWAPHVDPKAPPAVRQMIHAFTVSNVWLMLVNLVPVKPLDGAEAWRLFRLRDLFGSRRDRELRSRMRAIQQELGEIEKRAKEEREEVTPNREPPKDKSMLN